METIYEMKIAVTFIEKESPYLPYGCTNREDFEKKIKERLNADDVHVTDTKIFLRDDTEEI